MNTNTIKIIELLEPSSIEMGQIYQYENEFYIVARKELDTTGCLICLQNGNMWSDNQTAKETITQNNNFVLFRGSLQIKTEY